MKRIIEGLIAKRKVKQDNLKNILIKLGELIEGKKGFFKNKQPKIKDQFSELNSALNELILIQNKEWDAYSNNHATDVFKSLQWKIEKLEAEYSNVKSLMINFVELERNLTRLLKQLKEKVTDKPLIEELDQVKERLSVAQYADFELRFRGSEENIKSMLKGYIPFFKEHENILDIGCGRGEFLELLKEENIHNYLGIDISDSMLKIATGKRLKCIKKDALEFLKNSQENTFGGIFSSQVIEHLSPEDLRDLIMESFRVLKPDSPIILETINPLSIFALSNIYFLDITHKKPLHPEYMRYLVETSGFNQVEILYSGNLSKEKLGDIPTTDDASVVLNTNIDKLNKLLYSAPCYAVKGYK